MIYKAVVLRKNVAIGELNIISGDIKYNSESRIKRAANITVEANVLKSNRNIVLNDDLLYPSQDLFPSDTLFLKSKYKETENQVLNKMKDRIKITIDEKTLGKFMIVSSPKKSDGRSETFEFELYDETYILDEANISKRLYFPAGTLYLNAIKSIITSYGFSRVICDDNANALQVDREWEIGENALDIINELLKEINFNSFYIDNEGSAILSRKTKKTKPSHIYRDNIKSVLLPELSQNEDIYKIPNVFIGVVSRPEKSPLIYKKVNDDVNSSLSIQGRGFEITKVENLSDIASEVALKKYIDDLYLKSIQTVEIISFSTGIETDHVFEELIQIETDTISGLYKEVSWGIDLAIDGKMSHTGERSIYK